MLLEINHSPLCVDIVSSGLVAKGFKMVERPTDFILHGVHRDDHKAFEVMKNFIS